jgi:viroplasmin and RNaseH domain-containing protein
MESFTLGPTPKINFSSAQQQHLAAASEWSDQHNNFYNILSKLYGIQYRILTNNMPKPLFIGYKNPNSRLTWIT